VARGFFSATPCHPGRTATEAESLLRSMVSSIVTVAWFRQSGILPIANFKPYILNTVLIALVHQNSGAADVSGPMASGPIIARDR